MTDQTLPTQSPTNVLMTLIVAFLAPMFLPAAGGDIHFARAAATQTIRDYRVRNSVDLLAVAQIVAFGLAALGSLSLAMADDLPPSMVLRLRANAIAANRASEQCRKGLGPAATDTTSPMPPRPDDIFPDEAKIAAGTEQTREHAADARMQPHSPQPVAPPTVETDHRRRTVWASAMSDLAAQIEAGTPNLPPAQRREAAMRAAALSSVASHLLMNEAWSSHHPAPRQDPG